MKHTLYLALTLLLLSGCTTFKNLTGQNDNTVLPGQREEVLPPDQQTARDPIITGEQPPADDVTASQPVEGGAGTPCDPNAPDCVAPIDQEATAPGG